jgi:uncharacterized coiled-coil protein SlyX
VVRFQGPASVASSDEEEEPQEIDPQIARLRDQVVILERDFHELEASSGFQSDTLEDIIRAVLDELYATGRLTLEPMSTSTPHEEGDNNANVDPEGDLRVESEGDAEIDYDDVLSKLEAEIAATESWADGIDQGIAQKDEEGTHWMETHKELLKAIQGVSNGYDESMLTSSCPSSFDYPVIRGR